MKTFTDLAEAEARIAALEAQLAEAQVLIACLLDKPEDRLWHAEDGTWWRRDGKRLLSADPPPVVSEAQERLAMVVEALEQWAPPEFRICYRCKGVGTVATDTRGRPIPLAPCNYCDGSGINTNPRLLKTCAALSAAAEPVAQHTASVERRGAIKELEKLATGNVSGVLEWAAARVEELRRQR